MAVTPAEVRRIMRQVLGTFRHPRRRRQRRPGSSLLSGMRPLPWKVLVPGTVVDAFVSLSDGSDYGRKRRPVVVVQVFEGRVQVCPVTSRVQRFAGASQRGWVVGDVWRIVELDRRDLVRRVGALDGTDLDVFARRTAVLTAVPRLASPARRRSWWEDRCVGLRDSAVAALRGVDAARYADEWAYDMEQVTAGWARFRWALSLRLRAPRHIRRCGAARLSGAVPPSEG